MRATLNPNTRSVIRLGLTAVLTVAAGCSAAPAQTPEEVQVQPEPGDLWRCFAHQAYFKEREGQLHPRTTVATGQFVFHAVTPDEQWVSGAVLNFTSVAVDPAKNQGNGISAVVSHDQPDLISVYMTVDGLQRPLGTYPYGTPVPFKVTFDDAKGTVTVESGAYRMTAKPARLLRGTFNMACVGADVSFHDMDMR